MKKTRSYFAYNVTGSSISRYYMKVHHLEGEEGKNFKDFGRQKDIFLS